MSHQRELCAALIDLHRDANSILESEQVDVLAFVKWAAARHDRHEHHSQQVHNEVLQLRVVEAQQSCIAAIERLASAAESAPSAIDRLHRQTIEEQVRLANLLEGQLAESDKHLQSLRERDRKLDAAVMKLACQGTEARPRLPLPLPPLPLLLLLLPLLWSGRWAAWIAADPLAPPCCLPGRQHKAHQACCARPPPPACIPATRPPRPAPPRPASTPAHAQSRPHSAAAPPQLPPTPPFRSPRGRETLASCCCSFRTPGPRSRRR
jgi:hypothetical protein